MDDDFLWDCALDALSNSRMDIIPDYEDDMRHFCHDNLDKANIGATFNLISNSPNDTNSDINISITESRGNGVLDIIGGELWEGALLLCVYILQNQHTFLTQDVLELGSGVGLPGLLLAQLKANNLVLLQKVGELTLTDNDPRVVTNLNSSVNALNAHASLETFELEDINCSTIQSGLTLHTKILDWSVFATDKYHYTTTATSATPPSTTTTLTKSTLQDTLHHTTLPPAALEVSPICEVIMGCELCYAPYHAQCLAELLRYYLHRGYCKKVVICQMRDREGFSELLNRLQAMGIAYTVHEVTEDQYALAQSIRCSKVHGGNSSAGTDPGQVGCTGAANATTTAGAEVKSRDRANSENNSDVISKMFTFPAHICVGGGSTNADFVPSNGGCAERLLHSSKENFVFLTID